MPLEYQEKFKNRTLPESAEEFVQMNNNLKGELYKILDEYVNVEPRDISTHLKLKEIVQINTIITTNYDELFEQSYGKHSLSVIFKNKHITLANKQTKLYKIHGDLSDPDSIVLTSVYY